jgi:response regulator of citrate/malate metabolism
VSRLLQADAGFEVVGDCSSASAMRIINSQEIDVVLLDIDLGQERGTDFLESLTPSGSREKCCWSLRV